LLGGPKGRINSELKNGLNEAADIVTKNLAQSLVSLRRFGFASECVAKLRLDHAESSFNVRAFVIVLEKAFLIERKVVIHLPPDGGTFKDYFSLSGRRFMSDLRDAQNKGYLSKAAHYNSISRYLENAGLTPLLKALIEASSLPLQAVESDFAIDSSGFSTCRFDKWVDAKYGGDKKLMTKRNWIKVHLVCGVKTNIVTAVEITDRFAADINYFKPLVDTTAANFTMQEVSADKAYLSADNLQLVVDHTAMPYIPFKSNSGPNFRVGPKRLIDEQRRWQRKSTIWRQMYHYFSFNQERFLQHYHKRSNVETTFSMIKAKFGDALRSKTETAQTNEALCKILCHNICCLIQSIFEFGIEPTFWPQES